MLAKSAPEKNFTPALTPAPGSHMPWRVARVEAMSGFRLRVEFRDGLTGDVDMNGLVHSARAGVFAVLADESLFRQARVEHGAVIWPGNLDLAPDAMHRAIKADGCWTL